MMLKVPPFFNMQGMLKDLGDTLMGQAIIITFTSLLKILIYSL